MSMEYANHRPRVQRRLSMPMMASSRTVSTGPPPRQRVSRRSSISGFGSGQQQADTHSPPFQDTADPDTPTFSQAELDQKMKVIMRDKELWGKFKAKLAQSDMKAGLGLQIVMRNFLIDYEYRIKELEFDYEEAQSAVTTSSHSRVSLLKKTPRPKRATSIESSSSSFFQRALSSLGGDSWQLEEELSERDFGTSFLMAASNMQQFDLSQNLNSHNVNRERDLDASSRSMRSMDLSDIPQVVQPKVFETDKHNTNRGGTDSPSVGKSLFRRASAIGNMFMFKRLEEELSASMQISDSSLNGSIGSLNDQALPTDPMDRKAASTEELQGEDNNNKNNKNLGLVKSVTPPQSEDDDSDDEEDDMGVVWLGWNSKKR